MAGGLMAPSKPKRVVHRPRGLLSRRAARSSFAFLLCAIVLTTLVLSLTRFSPFRSSPPTPTPPANPPPAKETAADQQASSSTSSADVAAAGGAGGDSKSSAGAGGAGAQGGASKAESKAATQEASLPSWWTDVKPAQGPFYLSVWLYVPASFAANGINEVHGGPTAVRAVAEWMEYHRYAGLDHVWLYAAGTPETAPLLSAAGRARLRKYTECGFLEIVEGEKETPGFRGAQPQEQRFAAAKDANDRKGKATAWMLGASLDEYLVSATHSESQWLNKTVDMFARSRPNMAQMLIQARRFGWTNEAWQPTGRFFTEVVLAGSDLTEGHEVDNSPESSLFRSIWKPAHAHLASAVVWSSRKQLLHTGFTFLLPENDLVNNVYSGTADKNWMEGTRTNTLAASIARKVREDARVSKTDVDWPLADVA